MRDVPFDTIAFDDLAALKDAGVSESRHLDFKLELPGNSDEQRKEFLADVCSFANAGGGDIVFGVEEAKDADGKNTGTIAELRGLSGFNFDETERRLAAIVQDGLDPRVPSVKCRAVPGGTLGSLLVLRIGRSFVAPHLVKFKGGSRFFSRKGANKFQLDVHEIRAAFLESDHGAQRARDFRLDRIARIVADDTPVRTGTGPRWALHIVPVRSAWSADVDMALDARMTSEFKPMRTTSYSHRHNLDGLVAVSGAANSEESNSYALLFREGAVEAVDAGMLSFGNDKKLIPATQIERCVVDHTGSYVRLLRRLGVDAPLAIGLTLAGVRGYRIVAADDGFMGRDTALGFDRSEVLLPELVIDTEGVMPRQLRPVFDMMWQAAGLSGSPNFGSDGSWNPPR